MHPIMPSLLYTRCPVCTVVMNYMCAIWNAGIEVENALHIECLLSTSGVHGGRVMAPLSMGVVVVYHQTASHTRSIQELVLPCWVRRQPWHVLLQ